jgi:cytochrome P450 family 4
VTKIAFGRIFNIFQSPYFLYHLTPTCKEEKEVIKVINDFHDVIIKKGRKEIDEKPRKLSSENSDDSKKCRSLLDSLLIATMDGKPLSNETIRNEIAVFIFGGHDTSSTTISFCLFNIAKHPEVQAKIRDEIKSIKDIDQITFKDLNNLNYLENVINETLRIYPPAPVFFRKFREEVIVDSYTFPKDCKVVFSPYLMGRDKNIFPDPLKFNPDRFDSEITGKKTNPFAFLPFSAGESTLFL